MGAERVHRAQGSPPPSVAANGEQVDPSNMMPAPNQEPWPGQTAELTTERVASTIPKGDFDANWSYPSPQMFYNGAWRRTARISPCSLALPLAHCKQLVFIGGPDATPSTSVQR